MRTRDTTLGLGLLVIGCSAIVVDDSAGAGGSTESTGGATSSSGRPATTSTQSSSDTNTTSTSASTTTSSTSSTASTSTAEVTEDGATFIATLDLGTGSDCAPALQDCPAGQKCVWYVASEGNLRRDDAQCIPVSGSVAPFDACTLPNGIGPDITDDCGADSFCLEVYGTAAYGFCAPFSDWDCDAYPGTNGAFENGSDFPAACLRYPCNPLDSATCPSGSRCMFYPAFLYGNTMCWNETTPPDLALGSACDFGGCGPEKLCAPSEWLPNCEHERCCAQFCDLDVGTCEEAGTVCEPFPVAQANDPSYEQLGACLSAGTFG